MNIPSHPTYQRDEARGGESWTEAVLTSAGISSLAGVIAGLVWGGVGGRVAMRILFLTSDDRVRGITSDNGFEIGTISASTVFLLIFTSVFGGIAGLLYGVVRMVTGGPTWLIATGVGLATAAGGGAMLVQSDGVDFRILDPLWLAVLLFVSIPGLWAVTTVSLAHHLLVPGRIQTALPARIDERRWCALGWLVIAAITILGVIDLANDIGRLT